MLISAIVDAQDTAPECLAAVLFELLRRHSSQYNEQQIDRNRNRDLRKMIVRKAESSARPLMPLFSQYEAARTTTMPTCPFH